MSESHNGLPHRESAPPLIGSLSGDAFVFTGPHTIQAIPPAIPDGMGKLCRQCRKVAWRKSRWCWNCGFDFDRKKIKKFHHTKLLVLSLAANVALAVAVVVMLLNLNRS